MSIIIVSKIFQKFEQKIKKHKNFFFKVVLYSTNIVLLYKKKFMNKNLTKYIIYY